MQLIHGDCLEKMKDIPDGSVDMVFADLPYGTTSNKWDSLIPLDILWDEYLRIGKESAVFCFTSCQPFTTYLVSSMLPIWRHEWVWLKNRGSNFANTVREPFKEHETIQMFSRGKWTYNKQMQERTGSGADRVKYDLNFRSQSENYREFEGREKVQLPKLRVPSSWQKFNTDTSGLHPTIKPINMIEYFIRTYSNEGEIVLDNTMGSGSTGIACVNTNRNFIGIEKDDKYFEIAKKRIEGHLATLVNSAKAG
jgi:site-specific DNA-methyltransferase (adenine-specific)